jgi:hypothetical protein
MNLCCPYCGEEVKVPDESNEPEVPHEAQCCHCLSLFLLRQRRNTGQSGGESMNVYRVQFHNLITLSAIAIIVMAKNNRSAVLKARNCLMRN